MAYRRQTAQIYDLYFPADRSPEADRWAELAGASAHRLLEPMVGTAEVACLLAERGFNVTGVDISAAMLDVARQRGRRLLPDVAERITLVQADVVDMDLAAGHFDFAYVGNGSFNLLPGAQARLAALRAIRRALRPGGRLALELFGTVTTAGRSEPRTHAPLRPVPDGTSISKTSTVTRDPLAQTITIEETIRAGGDEWRETLTLWLTDAAGIVSELQLAGLGGAGFHDLSTLESLAPPGAGHRMLVVATRATGGASPV